MSLNSMLQAYKMGKISTSEVVGELEKMTIVPLSEGQTGLWSIQQMNPASYAYNVPIGLECRGGVDIEEAMTGALQHLAERHSLLAGSVHLQNGGLVHVPVDHRRLQVESIDVSGMSEPSLKHRIRQVCRIPFSLSSGPLIRLSVLKRSHESTLILIVAHHIVLDGASSVLLLDTLLTAYHSIKRGLNPPEVRSSATFADFVAWEREMVSSPKGQDHRAYWLDRLQGATPLQNMPRGFGVDLQQSSEGDAHVVVVNGDLRKRVESFVASREVTEAVFLLAVFKLMLFRYTGLADILVGLPFLGRPEKRFDDVIGHFINMIPLRTSIDGACGFEVFLAGLDASVGEVLDHAQYPFARIAKDLRRGDQKSLIQVSYNYQNFASDHEINAIKDKVKGSLDFDILDDIFQVGEYDLALDVIPGDELHLRFKYNPRVYSAELMVQMSEHFINLLSQVLENPNMPVQEYDLLTADEKRKLVDEWNRTEMALPEGKTIIHMFKDRVMERPSAPAVTYEEDLISYAELDKKSDELAAYLRHLGIGPGDRVGVCVDRSMDMIIALIATMKSGAAYVPLDPGYPLERLLYMIEDSACSLVVTQRTIFDSLFNKNKRFSTSTFLIDGGWANIKSPTKEAPLGDALLPAANDLAYLIYTSGSTGQPKGVMISHKSLLNFLLSMQESLGFSHSDKLLAVTTYCFDIAALELYLPLITGAHCVICGTETARDAERLKEQIRSSRPTFMQATPATWRLLCRVNWNNENRTKVLCGGEPLSETLKRDLLASGAEVWNMYGPTETTVWSTMKRLAESEPITVGKPIANTRTYVLDDRLRVVPVGVVGELYIGGEGVAQGYWNKKELTSTRFVASPFRQGDTMYRTGDLARWLPSGELEVIGRVDSQIKFRGHRIELGEIEAALDALPEIEKSVALVTQAGDEPGRLVAYCEQRGRRSDQGAGLALEEREIRQRLKEVLPEYMIPNSIRVVEDLPLTPNGKVDRRRLVEQSPAKPHQPASHVQTNGAVTNGAVNSIEEAIFRIYKDVLKQEDLDKSDRFFEAGGDSFAAVLATEKINNELGLNIKVTSVFKFPSVEAMASYASEILASRERVGEKREAKTETSGPGMAEAEKPRLSIDPHQDLAGCVAVIGISCLLPDAQGHWQFWENLRQEKDSIRFATVDQLRQMGVPEDLINRRELVTQCAPIEGKDLFDPAFFGISPRDAELLDPQGRLLLMHAWRAVEDAGYNVHDIPDTSVFMSGSNNFYQALLPGLVSHLTEVRITHKAEDYVAWLLAQGGTVPTLISNKLGFKGPSMYVSSNCSSSLTGLHLAYQSILSGEARHALVGAASIFPAESLGYLHQSGLNFSSDGRCKAFDASADGMAGGEGVAVVLLKNAEDAARDGDSIYALVRSVAVNNDGSDKAGFYAPSVRGQAEVIKRALEKGGVSPETIQYVEAHGTGTKIGDPIEIAALTDAYRMYTDEKQFCGIGSVKTNIGHLDAAAGLAGLIKVALSLHHGEVPKSLNYTRPNPDMELQRSPFYVARSSYKLKAGSMPNRAALSSFGIGGTNAHAILEQYKAATDQSGDAWPQLSRLVILSARSETQLKTYARSLVDFLPHFKALQKPLATLAYTLQVGRKPMNHRVAFLVENIDSLEACLNKYLVGERSPAILGCNDSGAVAGKAETSGYDSAEVKARLGGDLDDSDLRNIASLWLAGKSIDWRTLYGGQSPGRANLPAYPFEKKSYWLNPLRKVAKKTANAAVGNTQEPLQGEALTSDSEGGELQAMTRLRTASETSMNALLCRFLLSRLMELGAFNGKGTAAHAHRYCPIKQSYSRWLENSFNLLTKEGYLTFDGTRYSICKSPEAERIREDWEQWKKSSTHVPGSLGRAVLAEKTLTSLSDILTGKTAATAVIFPNSSLELVEGIYKNNAISDYFNQTVAKAVRTVLLEKLKTNRDYKLRICEIGAGTGSTSEHVFNSLAEYQDAVIEYCYTDISNAFFPQAEKRFRHIAPYLTCKRLDIEKRPSEQGIDENRYDIVIATNVIHATRSLRQSIANVASILRSDGAILLNELTENDVFSHLTFGLLDGWWRFTDSELRMPGGPAASPDDWHEVLLDCGFSSVRFLAEDAHDLGLQVVMGVRGAGRSHTSEPSLPESDSVAVQHKTNYSLQNHSLDRERKCVNETGSSLLEDWVRQTIESALVATLKLDFQEIKADESFADYGMDSLNGVEFVRILNATLSTSVDVTRLFDYPTVVTLTKYICDVYGSFLSHPIEEDKNVEPAEQGLSALEPGFAKDHHDTQAQIKTQAQRKINVKSVIVDALSASLKVEPSDISEDVSFSDYGVDSLNGVELVQRLNRELSLELDTTVLFDNPTVNKLCAAIVKQGVKQEFKPEHGRPDSASTPPPHSDSGKSKQANEDSGPGSKEPIAIIGIAGRFPKSGDVHDFWHHLEEGHDLVGQASRWDLSRFQCDCADGGFLGDIAAFDPLFFNISGLEASYMEPQQRIFLEEAWSALEDAGYAGDSLEQGRCGVYVGCTTGDYFDLTGAGDYPAQAFWGNMSSIVPARISYYLNLHGPALSVDTACSSSLVAAHLACQSLWSREVDTALAGGVFLACSPRLFIAGSRAGMLSPTGRCRPFDNAADGFVPAEGCGVLVLKRLSDAERDGDHIYGVIRGIGINQDGTTNGITAPSANSQQRLEQQVYDEFAIDCEKIQLVEAHGTGTKLGDPIEFSALVRAFRNYTDKNAFCALGSSKANIGHAQMAAGVIGIIKILMAIKHRKIPPVLHYSKTNDNFSLEGSPFYINDAVQDWNVKPGEKRCAAVSSFGASGTNAHAVIEEVVANQNALPSNQPRLFVLSAKSADQLRRQAENLLRFCRENPETAAAHISYTLVVGRKHFDHRLAIVARATEDLANRLDAWVSDGPNSGDWVFQSEDNEGEPVSQERNAAHSDSAELALKALAQAFVDGAKPDPDSLFADGGYKRVPLPTYPFERQRYWLPQSQQPDMHQRDERARSSLAPEIISNGVEASYVLTLSGQEFFLRDHKVRGRSILPGAAYLEMARSVVEHKLCGRMDSDSIACFHRVVLLQPASVEDSPATIRIRVTEESEPEFEIVSQSADGGEMIHCRGRASIRPRRAPAPVNLKALMLSCRELPFDLEKFYADYSDRNIEYGETFRGVRALYTGSGVVLAKICLPEAIAGTLGEFSIHPAIIDSAMHCLMFLDPEETRREKIKLLFAMQEVLCLDRCSSTMWAWIRNSSTGGNLSSGKIDISLVDERGKVCIVINGISTRTIAPPSRAPSTQSAANSGRAQVFLPVWDSIEVASRGTWPNKAERVVIVGRHGSLARALQRKFPLAKVVDTQAANSIDAIYQILKHIDSIDHIFWTSPDPEQKLLPPEETIERQGWGVMAVFYLVKALGKLGYGSRSLGWTFMMLRCQPLHQSDFFDPTHAGVYGIVGAIAKEYPEWQVRITDLPDSSDLSVHAALRLPADPNGNVYLHRNSEWFTQGLSPLSSPEMGESRFKTGGVYVIVGGAGGLGNAITEHLIRNYRARVIWLGRKPQDQSITEKLHALSLLGPKPHYLQADAQDPASLAKAHGEIKSRFGAINGLIQSALVFAGSSIDRMEESLLRDVLVAKVDVSARLVEEFKDEDLDFILFISSINSYLKAIGQSNYAAACSFKDAFSARIAQELTCAVKVVNLGYCFNNASQSASSAIARDMDFIERDELMEGLELLLKSHLNQITLMKTSPSINLRGIRMSNDPAVVSNNDTTAAGWSDEQSENADDQQSDQLQVIKERMRALCSLSV